MKHIYIVLLSAILPLFAFGIEGLGVSIQTAKPVAYSSPSAIDATPGMIVEIVIVVSADGMVEAIEVLRADAPGFESSVIDSVKNWRFTPALNNGKPVRSRILVPFRVVDEPEQTPLD